MFFPSFVPQISRKTLQNPLPKVALVQVK